MAGSGEEGEAATRDITQLRDDMPENSLVFGLMIRRQLSALSHPLDKPVDQGCPDVDFINIELGRRFSVLRIDAAASMQHQRDVGILGNVAKELKVQSRTVPVFRAD